MWKILSIALLAAVSGGYDQPYRPRFHFSPQKNWTNDPNGLVYFDGEYHLFYQFNPFGDQWGHMSWGHAVSPDLVHWKELPVALPEEDGIMIFTGSTVVDEHNTSGFCAGGRPCLVAIYTGHTPEAKPKPTLQTQNLAYSNDRGRTWTKFNGNPVLNLNMTDFRDPNVFWSVDGRRWIMVVALPNEHKVRIYGSGDLKRWETLSEFGPAGATGGQWECPDLFQVHVNNTKDETRWVMKIGLNPGALQGGSGEQYFVGWFDGTRFINENPASLTLWTDYGKDCYCALTYNGLKRETFPVMLGWMNNWQYAGKVPTSPWRGQMTLPRRVALERSEKGIRLIQDPIRPLAQLRSGMVAASGATPEDFSQSLSRRSFDGGLFELQTKVALGSAQEIGFKLLSPDGSYTLVSYDKQRQQLFVDRTHSGLVDFSPDFPARTAAPLVLGGEPLRLNILVDRSSVEVFAMEGRLAMTNLIFPPKGVRTLQFYAKGGQPGPMNAVSWRLGSIW
jgi:fructan beta-fructosidase